MPDLRKDPIVGRWVIVAKSRAKRPHDFDTSLRLRRGGFCPFCEGHEDKTPGEIIAYRNPGSRPNREGWRVRVVPNKFPALEIEGNLSKSFLRKGVNQKGPDAHGVCTRDNGSERTFTAFGENLTAVQAACLTGCKEGTMVTIVVNDRSTGPVVISSGKRRMV